MRKCNLINLFLLSAVITLVLTLSVGCTYEEKEKVVMAAKRYPVAGSYVEKVIELQFKVLQNRHRDLRLSWSEKHTDENNFELIAELRPENSLKARKRYVFHLRKNFYRTHETGVDVWRMEPRSSSAKKLVNLTHSEVRAMKTQLYKRSN